MSLDGRTATAPGDSPWISGEQSRELVHRWRAESDAIAVGIGTVLADDPLLTARHPDGARQPIRVVFDSQARLPLDSQLSRPSTSPRSSSSPPPTPTRPASALCATPAPRSSSPAARPGRAHRLSPRRPRPPRHHQPLPRGRPNPRLSLPRRRPARRIPYLHRPGAARASESLAAGAARGAGAPWRARPGAGAPQRGETPATTGTRAPIRPRVHAEPVGDDVLITARFKEW